MRTAIMTMGVVPALLLTACQGEQPNNVADNGMDANAAMLNGGPASGAAMAPAMQATSATDYLAQAGAGDLFEIESSRAVLEKSKDAKVRDFATMMVKAHEQSTAKLKAAAAEANMTVQPPKLTPAQQSMLDGIKNAAADRVDATYIANQKAAHQTALAVHRAYADDGDSAPLKRAAGEIVPVVESHIRQLAEMPGE